MSEEREEIAGLTMLLAVAVSKLGGELLVTEADVVEVESDGLTFWQDEDTIKVILGE